jgi:HTH-type transcriptional regulator/antitoxin HigA
MATGAHDSERRQRATFHFHLNVAISYFDPIEAILFRMDQQNLNKKDLIPYFGSLSKVSAVLSRKRSLSLAMIRKLHAGLGIPAEVLIAGSDEEGFDLGSEPQYDSLIL